MSRTLDMEDKYLAPFSQKIPLSIERGEGVFVWDEEGRKFMDFTSGWGVTSLGHAHMGITMALLSQAQKIIQNPNAGLTYSPARAELLELMTRVLPGNINRVFFTNSGAETNDAAIKLARKASGRLNIISTTRSFHGRTISTISATGQDLHRSRFKPLMPHYLFVPYDDYEALEKVVDQDTAAVIIEPIQGEGGVYLPGKEYMRKVAALCRSRGAYLIADEVQTGFFRTGPAFAIEHYGIQVDFLSMAKGIAGGFPFGALGMTEAVCRKLEQGDHGGTYCGNPLGCAVAAAVVREMLETHIGDHVKELSAQVFKELKEWQTCYPGMIAQIRGQGFLILIEFADSRVAEKVEALALEKGLLLNRKHGKMIRLMPALNITREHLLDGLMILKEAVRQTREETVREE